MTPSPLHAGTAAVEITPRMPVDLAGSMIRRPSEGVTDPLFVRVVVLENASERLAFILLDLICFNDEDCLPLRREISQRLGVAEANVCISCTHTHRGPSTRRTSHFFTQRNEEWMAWMLGRVVEAVETAAASLVPAEVAWGRGHEARPQSNRRWHLQGGPVRTNPRAPEVPSHPAGPTDPDIPFLLVRRRGSGELLAAIANYSLHYIGDGPGRKISADYFGRFSQLARERFGEGMTALLTHGTSGDINNLNHTGKPTPWYPEKPAPGEKSDLIAGWLLDQMEAVLEQVAWHESAVLAATQDLYTLRIRKPDEEEIARSEREAADEGLTPALRSYARSRLEVARNYPAQLPRVISSLRVGDWAASTFPAEMFCQFGLDLKYASPFPVTAPIELANGHSGYIATRYSYELGGYETWLNASTFAVPGSGEEMVLVAIRQLLRLHGGNPPVLAPLPTMLP
ncbi:MAG TPA: hypothetical protein VNQ90_11525 [Chthoniobacteraceae bacterium]|nr:hypothetical protein [Chthoniobacteraceae bacterium]